MSTCALEVSFYFNALFLGDNQDHGQEKDSTARAHGLGQTKGARLAAARPGLGAHDRGQPLGS